MTLHEPTAPAAELTAVPRGSRGTTKMIHDYLRSRILSGALPAGSELSQAGVAKECGVSRGPVREAFRLLQTERLITAETNQRPRVATLSVEDVEHVYALRVVNEAVGLSVSVPRFTAEQLQEMDDLVEAIDRSRTLGFEAWETQHRKFHMLLLKHAGERMVSSAADWADHTERYRRVYLSDDGGGWSQGAREHAEVVRLCRERDASNATQLLARHLSRAAITLIALMDPTHDAALLRAAVRQVTLAGDAIG